MNTEFSYTGQFVADLTIPPVSHTNKEIKSHYNMIVTFTEGKTSEITWFSINALQQMIDLGIVKL
ncbi:MAG: hypothetical protein K9K38_11945 [Rhodoferax sp.]|nr:hypothetical protein [Rhodoferax sp.]MCF8210098.1 hypothetical protein [Rhodoferax sp.]